MGIFKITEHVFNFFLFIFPLPYAYYVIFCYIKYNSFQKAVPELNNYRNIFPDLVHQYMLVVYFTSLFLSMCIYTIHRIFTVMKLTKSKHMLIIGELPPVTNSTKRMHIFLGILTIISSIGFVSILIIYSVSFNMIGHEFMSISLAIYCAIFLLCVLSLIHEDGSTNFCSISRANPKQHILSGHLLATLIYSPLFYRVAYIYLYLFGYPLPHNADMYARIIDRILQAAFFLFPLLMLALRYYINNTKCCKPDTIHIAFTLLEINLLIATIVICATAYLLHVI